jgi:hypothetical protein
MIISTSPRKNLKMVVYHNKLPSGPESGYHTVH